MSGPPDRRRLLRRGLLLAALLLFVWDLSRPASAQVTGRLLAGGIDLYQATLSPLMPRMGVHCRFVPTCSRYTEAAIRADGALVGVLRWARRIARCGPWTPMGTVDPP